MLTPELTKAFWDFMLKEFGASVTQKDDSELMMYEVKRRPIAIPITDLRVVKDEESRRGHTVRQEVMR